MGEEGQKPAQCEYPHCDHIETYPVPQKKFNERQFCIFHWDPEDKEEKRQRAEIFNEQFNRLVEASTKNRQPLKCRGFVFPDRFSFCTNNAQSIEILPNSDFSFSKFGEGVSFANAKFGNGVRFEKAVFGPGASFEGGDFGGTALFPRAIFRPRADFRNATFAGKATFDDAAFGEEAYFGGTCSFGPCSSFDRATFGKRTKFYETTFENDTSFHEAIFEDQIRFRNATFKGRVNFTGSVILSGLSFSGEEDLTSGKIYRVFSNEPGLPVNFQRVRFERPELVQFSTVDLSNASFLNTDVSNVNFVGVDWSRKNGSIHFQPRVEYEDGRSRRIQFEKTYKKNTLEWLERLCQQLKLNFENKRNYYEAGEFHWAEMEYRRQRHWMNKEWLPAVMLNVYKFLSGFGERIPRAAAVLFVSLLLAVFLQGRFGVFHAPKWVRPPGEAACVLEDDRPFRILQDPPLIEDPCVDRAASWYEAYYQAGKFTLQDVTFQKPEEQYPASPFGRGLSLFMRLFFPIQLGLLFVAIKRRFRR